MVEICIGRNQPLGHDDVEDDGKDGDDEGALLLAEHNDDDDDDDDEDDVKDGDDERALLLAEHNYLFVRGLPLAALHLVATDPLCKSSQPFSYILFIILLCIIVQLNLLPFYLLFNALEATACSL